jgi:hypothetical protein
VHLMLRKQDAIKHWDRLEMPANYPGVAVLVEICSKDPCSAGSCKHALQRLLVLAVHLPAGPETNHFIARKKRLYLMLDSLCKQLQDNPPHAMLLLGDFNIRQEEVKTMTKVIKSSQIPFAEAPGAPSRGPRREALDASLAEYEGTSWDPRHNSFKFDAPKIFGYNFDRIFYVGNIHVSAALVGHSQTHAGIRRFALSDHYAVRGVLTLGLLDGSTAEPNRAGRLIGNVNLHLCILNRQEQAVLNAAEMRVKQTFHSRIAQQQYQGQELTAKMKRDKIQVLLQRQNQRKSYWESVFGDSCSFFLDHAFLSSFDIRKTIDFVTNCFTSVIKPPSVHPDGGFANAGNTCYVNVVAQVLLRLLPVRTMIKQHTCSDPKSCVLCALWDSKDSLGRGRFAQMPRLAVDRHLLGSQFADNQQHDAVEFLESWISLARAAEIKSGKAQDVPFGCDIRFPEQRTTITSMDSLFLTVEERRGQCPNCEQSSIDYTASYVVKLPLPLVETGTPSEAVLPEQLYHTFCARTQPTDYATPCCPHNQYWEQRRYIGQPKVLLLHVRRQANLNTLSRHLVSTSEDLSLDDGTDLKLGNWRLQAIIYHHGRNMNHGHYTCACRHSDDCFRYYDDKRVFTMQNLQTNLSAVVLLVYVRRQ